MFPCTLFSRKYLSKPKNMIVWLSTRIPYSNIVPRLPGRTAEFARWTAATYFFYWWLTRILGDRMQKHKLLQFCPSSIWATNYRSKEQYHYKAFLKNRWTRKLITLLMLHWVTNDAERYWQKQVSRTAPANRRETRWTWAVTCTMVCHGITELLLVPLCGCPLIMAAAHWERQ